MGNASILICLATRSAVALPSLGYPNRARKQAELFQARLIQPMMAFLGAVDNSSVEARRPAACPRDPEMLMNMQVYCTEIDRTGSREQVAGRRNINCQQPLIYSSPS